MAASHRPAHTAGISTLQMCSTTLKFSIQNTHLINSVLYSLQSGKSLSFSTDINLKIKEIIHEDKTTLQIIPTDKKKIHDCIHRAPKEYLVFIATVVLFMGICGKLGEKSSAGDQKRLEMNLAKLG